jgi:hypothetical protein
MERQMPKMSGITTEKRPTIEERITLLEQQMAKVLLVLQKQGLLGSVK